MRSGTDYNVLVDIPEGAHRCADDRVYIVLEKRYYEDLRYNMDSRAWLGKAVNDKQMYPNSNYKAMYSEKLKSVVHINLPIYVKRMGIYAASLAVGENTGLYEDLVKCFGPRSANLIMDYASYSIHTKTNVAKDFETEMADQMLFLDKPYSDSWIQDQFDNVITDNQIYAFKNAWLGRFSKEDLSDVWICIDGSNDDCTVNIDEAEKGKAKSHKNIDIISFLYAVTDTGIPVISQIYRGSRVDCQALKEMIAVIAGFNLKPKGVILDRGFCDENCIWYLQENSYDFVIMMKENTCGFNNLLEKYRDEIKLKWKYALGHGLFGVCDKVKLFRNSDLEIDASITWDAKNGVERISYLIDEIMSTVQEAEAAISNGKQPNIPKKYRPYLEVITNNDASSIIVLEEKVQAEIQAKGFYGLICSKPMSVKEANVIYDLRDSSEKQCSLMKTQLGDSVFRAHNMHRIFVRETIAFVASIIRHDLMIKCRQAKPIIDTNTAIKELNLINMNLIGDVQYKVIHNQCKRQKEILSLLGISSASRDHIAAYETSRFKGKVVFPIQTLKPDEETETQKETQKIKGIPAGSSARGKGSKKTPVSSEKESISNPAIKRGPGRPKGSKNKPKEKDSEQITRRGPGRPKGSKNKPKTKKNPIINLPLVLCRGN